MKIGINLLSVKIGGGVSFARNIIKNLSALDQNNEYILFVPAGERTRIITPDLKLNNIRVVELFASNILLRLVQEQFVLPVIALMMRVKLLFCPANLISFLAPCHKVLWIQNIDPFVTIPGETLKQRVRNKILFWFGCLSMKWASFTIFSSKYSLDLVLGQCQLDSKKTKVIFLGISEEFLETQEAPREPFLLSVSNISKRKNYELLIRAFVEFKRLKANDYKLIIVGRVDDQYKQQLLSLADTEAARQAIIFTGELSGPALVDYYQRGAIFVLPSLVESFGLTTVEAMAAGLPVLAANATCLPEIVGQAGLLFDPNDPPDLSKKIRLVLEQSSLREKLSRQSRARAQEFNWRKTAEQTLAIFKEIEQRD